MEISKKILFVCVENSGRSQIAEGFLRKLFPSVKVESAGTSPATKLNPMVVQVMKEIEIDITCHKPKLLTNKMISESTVVNMGCMDRDSCPALFVKDVIEWNIADPKGKSIEEVREIRDHIQKQIMVLLENLGKT